MIAPSLARQATLVAALRDPACFPHPVGRIEVIETHISWVVLTGSYAYKIKKSVDLGFLDYTTLALREHFCREELRLNRRLAADYYLDVVPITRTPNAPIIGGDGEVIEWAVKMREFERGGELSCLLPTGAVTPATIDEIADCVAAFHAICAQDTAVDGYGSTRAVRGPVRNNIAALERRISEPALREQLMGLRDWSEAEHQRLTPAFDTRRSEGFVRECHGDLHLGNIALHGGRVVVFDCIEFDARLRWIDVLSEIAFSVMDFHHRGRPDFARRLLNRYLERTGDYSGLDVLRYYLVYRALVRATVETIRSAQAGAQGGAKARGPGAYLDLAAGFTRRHPPRLLITHGVSGSGKTSVTSALLEAADCIRIRSDVERKRLAGLSSETRSASQVDAGLYTAEIGRRTYDRLNELARSLLRAGFQVLVDATFLERSARDALRALAASERAPFGILACRAGPAILRERVASRSRTGRDASDAGPSVLEAQLDRGADLDADEMQEATVIDTSRPIQPHATAEMLGLVG